jgi:hypothetical protein
VGSGGTMISNYTVGPYYCNTDATGTYSGPYPTTVGGSVTGTLCYYYFSACEWTYSLTVTNCNGYYVYYISLPTATCYMGICTM